ncbi:SDR family oxidoreductase [Flavobacterium sp. NST-5]|uniref:SDR family oxidoreductase n=1 Tax=Flavobacterium ichthyis TaxID=2698827 RepID=A0ABW9Z622_9FLAO|nr:SDR family oxidoreductase [Flavobacterium ichthyis]NBL64124.1 SDR family oxidoreductase [Flavobacterium ichthyis]
MKKLKNFPEQKQSQPGIENKMTPEPQIIRQDYYGSQKLMGKVALITGGDSGIGRSIAVHFAREGADVALAYFDENEDAKTTKDMVNAEGRKCLLFKGDLKKETFCKKIVSKTIEKLGKLDILVNNAAMQFPKKNIADITTEQVQKTFKTNIFPFFYTVIAAIPHLKKGASIINTTSVTAYRGSEHLLDYSSTKGAIVAFTRSASLMLVEKKIRVNAVAPGPIWTPLIPATFRGEDLKKFGQDTPMGRAGQPSEVAPAYVFLASEDASYITGQVIHINGGEIIGG